jgi:hypothetical protein
MNLIYRGTTYDYHPACRFPQPGYELMYRGETYRVDRPAAAVTSKPAVYELIYRGSTYRASRNQDGNVTLSGAARNRRDTAATSPAIS